jgi:uncharacterized protein HemX
MPDQKIDDVLQGFLGWVQKQKDAAKEPVATQPAPDPATTPAQPQGRTPASPWNWVVGLIIAAVVFIGLAFLAWYLWSRGKELAKLRHEKDVAEETKHQAEVQAGLTVLDEKREALELEAYQAEGRIETLRMAIQRAEAERQAAHARLDTITSWDDVDRMIKERQP